jgi:hypothetical protein
MVHRGEGEKEKRRKIARGGEEGRGEGERADGEKSHDRIYGREDQTRVETIESRCLLCT